MFVDYDGVVKTYAENFPDELHDENMPFSMSMIRVLSNIAGLSGLPAYFMPMPLFIPATKTSTRPKASGSELQPTKRAATIVFQTLPKTMPTSKTV